MLYLYGQISLSGSANRYMIGMIDMPLKPLEIEDSFSPFTNVAENSLNHPGLLIELQEMERNQMNIFSQASVLLERKNLFIAH